jgi:branched-chain amino acid transport system substrate-binding protein
VFRYLPNDREIKVAHARYVVDTLKAKKIALINDTTAYGQGGYNLLKEIFEKPATSQSSPNPSSPTPTT